MPIANTTNSDAKANPREGYNQNDLINCSKPDSELGLLVVFDSDLMTRISVVIRYSDVIVSPFAANEATLVRVDAGWLTTCRAQLAEIAASARIIWRNFSSRWLDACKMDAVWTNKCTIFRYSAKVLHAALAVFSRVFTLSRSAETSTSSAAKPSKSS